MGDRFDIVIYGATGFTGLRCVQAFATSQLFKGLSVAVAGRSETKLRLALDQVSAEIGRNVRDVPIIIASTEDEESLHAMARKAKVIVNAVGPYRLHGEAVVRAAVDEGASHVDISGEPAFLEKMALKYNDAAREKGVYVVGACGWDSIPADLGINYLKGYSFNAGTYQTLVLGISSVMNDNLGKVLLETYIRVGSLFWSVLLALWLTVFSLFALWTPTRKILQKYPDICSFNMFKNSGPTREQMEQAGFVYWFIGNGYKARLPSDQQHTGKPDVRVVASCRGPDAGYIATSGCVMSSALAILKDSDTLPKQGGVYTTAAAFADTKIYDYLKDFGVVYQVANSVNDANFQIETDQSKI